MLGGKKKQELIKNTNVGGKKKQVLIKNTNVGGKKESISNFFPVPFELFPAKILSNKFQKPF